MLGTLLGLYYLVGLYLSRKIGSYGVETGWLLLALVPAILVGITLIILGPPLGILVLAIPARRAGLDRPALATRVLRMGIARSMAISCGLRLDHHQRRQDRDRGCPRPPSSVSSGRWWCCCCVP